MYVYILKVFLVIVLTVGQTCSGQNTAVQWLTFCFELLRNQLQCPNVRPETILPFAGFRSIL
jgi:hypothetical protein